MSQGDNQDEAEKSFEPTQKKLDDARRKGDIPRSTDLNATAAFVGLFLAFFILSTGYSDIFASHLAASLAKAEEHSWVLFSGKPQPLIAQLLSGLIPSLAVLFSIPLLSVAGVLIATRTITFAPSKVTPKLNRISVKQNAINKFGRSGLFEFSKSFMKLAFYSTCLGLLISANLEDMIASTRIDPALIVMRLWEILLNFLGLVILISAAVGVLDYLFQYHEHRRKLRMSRKEIQDETKESEGDPHLKQERRRRGQEAAMSQSISDTKDADVVITNPTHFAVALKWSRKAGEAPVCVSKGQDNLAFQIRTIAEENAVPIHQDPPTARAIFATTEIGDEIAPDLYKAVAVAIRFAESMQARQKRSSYL